MPQLTLENPMRDQKYPEDRCGGAAEDQQEEATHRIAWAAVKRSYVKLGNDGLCADELSATGRDTRLGLRARPQSLPFKC